MAEPHSDCTSETRRKGSDKRVATNVSLADSSPDGAQGLQGSLSPCGACKFLRRKCVSGCIFSPHFASDQGAAKFAVVHRVFGASNVSKNLLHIPVHRRHEAVVTISYEAQARLSDPIYGCVSSIIALQQQVTSLEVELAMVQSKLKSNRFAMANVLQSCSQPQQQQQEQQLHKQVAMLQLAYSNNSSASTNFINITNFNSNFDLVADNAPSNSHSLKGPLHFSQPSLDYEDDEEESRIPDGFCR